MHIFNFLCRKKASAEKLLQFHLFPTRGRCSVRTQQRLPAENNFCSVAFYPPEGALALEHSSSSQQAREEKEPAEPSTSGPGQETGVMGGQCGGLGCVCVRLGLIRSSRGRQTGAIAELEWRHRDIVGREVQGHMVMGEGVQSNIGTEGV